MTICMEPYFIEHAAGRSGPYDLLGVIRKIRNGSLAKDQPLARGIEAQAKPAAQHSELYEVFAEQDKVEEEYRARGRERIRFSRQFAEGVSIMKEDLTAAVLTGFVMLTIVMLGIGATMVMPPIVAAFLVPIIGYGCFNLMLVAMLRVARVQLLSLGYIGEVLQRHGLTLLLCGLPPALAAFSLPWVLSDATSLGMKAWIFLVFPGVPIMAYYAFVPLLMIDRDVTRSEAFAMNRHIMGKLGLDALVTICWLFMINLLVLPTVIGVLVTLPISLLGMMTLFDKYYYE